MAGQRWEQEEIDALTWFVKKREKYKAALAQSSDNVRLTERKWTWPDIATKMHQIAERDEWQVRRKYEASGCQIAWKKIQAREISWPNTKSQAKYEAEDEEMTGLEARNTPQHGTGETVDAFPVKTNTRVDATLPLEISPLRCAPVSASEIPNEVQIRFQHGLDHTVDVNFDRNANIFTIAPKPAVPAFESTPENARIIKAENAAYETPLRNSVDTDRILAFALNSSPTPTLNSDVESHMGGRENLYSASPAPHDENVKPVRSNTRWEDYELEALQWFVKKRAGEPPNGRSNGRNRIWTWDTIAAKMNKMAARDLWDIGRVYTAGNCYGAWLTKSTRLPTSRPSKSRKLVDRTRGVPVHRTANSGLESTVNAPNGPIENTINPPPPPPGPNATAEPVPYHWLAAEREALHEVYNFSRIAESKGLTRAECRRRGLWTWTMIATEMNNRAKVSSWSTGQVYDQSNCYNMIKYEKDNFNLQGNVQPLEPINEDEDENEGDDDDDDYKPKV
ncbi:hypothetical protein ONS96_002754 [Cadophora gregata f. sp. sojae]|nr:hypothetical protein ONS96_002754 [Cadophora gregata f. sp. sojae]